MSLPSDVGFRAAKEVKDAFFGVCTVRTSVVPTCDEFVADFSAITVSSVNALQIPETSTALHVTES